MRTVLKSINKNENRVKKIGIYLEESEQFSCFVAGFQRINIFMQRMYRLAFVSFIRFNTQYFFVKIILQQLALELEGVKRICAKRVYVCECVSFCVHVQ